MSENTKDFERYQKGKDYNNKLGPSYYDIVDCNWDFYYGKHWRGANLDPDLPQPVFNNINRFVTFFVASIMSNKTKVLFESPVTLEEDDTSDMILNESWLEFTERVKMDWKTKKAITEGAVTGDYIAHLYMNVDKKSYNGAYSDIEGQIDFELIDSNNFYMSNPNSSNIEDQRWVQIAGRDLISNLNEEMKEQAEIQEDNDTVEQATNYGQIELGSSDGDGKATYVITYEIKDSEQGVKSVFASKSVKEDYIYKDVDLGIDRIPVAFGNWEEQRNTYHGMSFVTSAIPTQIYINRSFALAMYNTMTTAFPKYVYNKQKISNWSAKVGGGYGVTLAPGERLTDVATYLSPGQMSPQVPQMIEMAQQYMKETVGANDALLGNVNPEQASGVSIAVSSKQASIPLENPKMNMYNWLEDIGRIYFEMVSKLYGERPIIIEDGEEKRVEMFDFSTLQNMYKTIKIDVGASSYWSEIAMVQTLDNLLANQRIEFIQYLERMPEGYIRDKKGLIDDIKELEEEQKMFKSEMIQNLTPEQQEEFKQLSPEEQEQLLQQAYSA